MKDKNLTVVHSGSGPAKDQEQEVQNLYEVLKKLPKPLASLKLSAAQKKWWMWFGLEFLSTNQFTKLDQTHLQKAAFWMDARCQAIKQINAKGYAGGLVQTFVSGATNVSGHVSIIEKADKHLDEVSAHFGMSIKDRQKLKGTEEIPDNQLSLFEQALKQLHG